MNYENPMRDKFNDAPDYKVDNDVSKANQELTKINQELRKIKKVKNND